MTYAGSIMAHYICSDKVVYGGNAINDLSDKTKNRTRVFDLLLITTLVVVGILAIIGSGAPSGHALHTIGFFGKAGGGMMIAVGSAIGLVDASVHIRCSRDKMHRPTLATTVSRLTPPCGEGNDA